MGASDRRKLWICRFAWTTQTRCPHTHSSDRKKRRKRLEDSFQEKENRNGRRLYTLIPKAPGPTDGVHLIENSEGNLEEADTAEERIIEEMRHLGREGMQGWAERQVEVTEQEIRQQPRMHRQGKKTPLAYETRRDRAPGAAISVGEKRAPVPAECESHSSRLFAGFAARDHRFCRRSTFRSGADEVAGALWLRDGREHDPEDRSGPRQEHLKRAE